MVVGLSGLSRCFALIFRILRCYLLICRTWYNTVTGLRWYSSDGLGVGLVLRLERIRQMNIRRE